jgi:hypothetical protein
MVRRSFWIERIRGLWRERSVVWLMGVRRVGKTTLARSLPDVEYLDCELPRVRRELEDPETFLASVRGRSVVLDEVQRLSDPAELLKIAADHFPDVRLLATGSSTLGASARFRDTLAGRKAELWLTPMIGPDLVDFRQPELRHRLLHGGLPPYFLSKELPEREFQEWMDAYWARDVMELFRVERRASFQRFAELLIAQSGGMFEATRFARDCEVSRTTITNYLALLESTFVAHVLRPFSTRRATEIRAAPKVYGFDTGFVCTHRGWDRLRNEDLGFLWEHFVLNEIHGRLGERRVHYWRDKHGHEVDFVIARRGKPPIAIECKWSERGLDTASLASFLRAYPEATAYVVTQDAGPRPSPRRTGEGAYTLLGLEGLIRALAPPASRTA